MPESLEQDPEEEKWKEVTQWRTENKDWLELSFSIALCVIDEMERTGITQKELAKRMQVRPQQVSKILKGSENLTLETICKLNSALGIQLIEVKKEAEPRTNQVLSRRLNRRNRKTALAINAVFRVEEPKKLRRGRRIQDKAK